MLVYLDTIIAFAVIMLGLSLLVTLFNQMISAFLGYRGTNLRWGIETMLRTLSPTLDKRAREIANQLLTEPVISDSVFGWLRNVPGLDAITRRWRLASAIGPDSLVRTLTKVSEDLRQDDKEKGKPNPDEIPDEINKIIDQIDEGAARKLKLVKDAFNGPPLDPRYAVQLDDFFKQLGNSAQQSVGKVEAWFNVAMNRVSQRFTMFIRIWTIIFSFVLAFGLHLDSFHVINQLLGDPALRQKFVEQSGPMLKEAEDVLGTEPGQQTSGTTEPATSPQVLTDKMKELIEKDIEKQKEAKPALLAAVPSFNNFAEAEKWLRDNLNADDTRKNQLATKYRGYVIAGLKDKAQEIADKLQKAGIELLPADRKLADLKNDWIKFFFSFNGTRNFLGVLFTAMLLGLGSPFWYNALKTLTNLRPMVATRQDQQKKDAAAS